MCDSHQPLNGADSAPLIITNADDSPEQIAEQWTPAPWVARAFLGGWDGSYTPSPRAGDRGGE